MAGDAERLPFADGTFDVVTAIHMLSHVPDLASAVAETRRVLATGGRLIATANSPHSYPHVGRYRSRAFQMLDWGEPRLSTSHFNLENMQDALRPHWQRIRLVTLTGELRIPQHVFPDYFDANIDVWSQTPTARQRDDILRWVNDWSYVDQRGGHIIEPKIVGIAICSDE